MSVVLRSGYTTGTCAAAAAKAAAWMLCHGEMLQEVEILLPKGDKVLFPILSTEINGERITSSVRKDAGDDPDVTNQMMVQVTVSYASDSQIHFVAGEGVGTVTKPGLSVTVGEPAINPAPRQMISDAVREVSDRGFILEVSIPGGKEIAEKTFNPRLGIVGGLSVLGTTGIVRPFSSEAIYESLKCSVSVAVASGVFSPVLVPGNIGEKAAQRHFRFEESQLISVSNQWGFMLKEISKTPFKHILIVGHPGKLAKFLDHEWDTHSSKSSSAVPIVKKVATEVLGENLSESPTVEGLFEVAQDRDELGRILASKIRKMVCEHLGTNQSVAVALINMRGDILGMDGDVSPWK